MELFMRNSYRAILTDVSHMIEKYMSLVKNFPITFNGSKIRQTIESLVSQLNKVVNRFLLLELGLRVSILINDFIIKGVVCSHFDFFDRSTQIDKRIVALLHESDVSSRKQLTDSKSTCKLYSLFFIHFLLKLSNQIFMYMLCLIIKLHVHSPCMACLTCIMPAHDICIHSARPVYDL